MSENAFKQMVTNLEQLKDDKNHEYLLVTTRLKDGTSKQKKVYDRALKKKFTVPGWYELRYDDDTHYLIGVEFIEQVETDNGNQPAVASASPIPSKSLKNDLQGQLDVKNREIRGAVILKACSEYLAAIAARGRLDAPAGSTDAHAMETEAHHAFKVFQNLLEAYVANKQPDFESTPF